MAITGHKTEKAFLSYIKVSEEEHAELESAAGTRLPRLELGFAHALMIAAGGGTAG